MVLQGEHQARRGRILPAEQTSATQSPLRVETFCTTEKSLREEATLNDRANLQSNHLPLTLSMNNYHKVLLQLKTLETNAVNSSWNTEHEN